MGEVSRNETVFQKGGPSVAHPASVLGLPILGWETPGGLRVGLGKGKVWVRREFGRDATLYKVPLPIFRVVSRSLQPSGGIRGRGQVY